MDTTRWQRIQNLFHHALHLSEPHRTAFLEAEARRDPEIAAEVNALLAEDARDASLLDGGVAPLAHSLLQATPRFETIGPYKITGVLGRGGMGIVYLAERDDLGSKAAIKVLRDAALSPDRRERFAREQQMLVKLDHPSIAKLFDAGTLRDGTPYFVMEYVEGMSLTEFCEAHTCSLAERLRLFRSVCEAVRYAHQHEVVHRDLKPSNIFVDVDGRVKLLDFGIAKHLAADADLRVTQTGLPLMTPAYAAPEQLRAAPTGVYTDVYALGVILYELLTGVLPYDLSGRSAGQIEALILEKEPERPSMRILHTAHNGLASHLSRSAWADLDVFCLTALQKDPNRRYASAESLLRDLDHFLGGEPLDARPNVFGYRLSKFLRRNRSAASAAALVAALVIGMTVFYTVRLADARDQALSQSQRTIRIERFLLNLFAGGDEAVGPADTLRVVTLLDRGVAQARALDSEPAVQAELYYTLGGIYQKLGRLEKADSLLQTSLDQRRSIYGPEHPDVAQSLIALGLLRVDQAVLADAEQLVQDGLEQMRRQDESPAIAEALGALGNVKTAQGEYDRAVELLEEAVRMNAARTPAGVELSESLSALADAHFYAGRYNISDSLNRLVLILDQNLYGRRHPNVASILLNLAASQFQLGYYAEAERLCRQALEITIAYHGLHHQETAATMMQLGQALTYQDRYDEAMDLLRPALATRERVYGPNHPKVASALNELGGVALQRGDLASAEEYYKRMVDIYNKVYGDSHYLLGIAQSNLASVYLSGNRLDRAEPLFRQVVDLFTRTLSAEHVNTAIAHIKLGRTLTRMGRYADAKEHLTAGYDVLAAQANASVSYLKAARTDLIIVYDALGERSMAERFRAESAAQQDS